MRRREFLAGATATAAVQASSTALAQGRAMPVIGLLGAGIADDAEVVRNIAAFRRGLAEMGYFEGRNVRIEYRWADGRYERLPALAADLVARKVDVIVNEGGAPSLAAAKDATSAIPIVFHTVADPVADGLVQSLAHPGGNLTGVNTLSIDLASKLLQLLVELVPTAKIIALLVNPENPAASRYEQAVQAFADSRGMRWQVLTADGEAGLDAAFARLDREPVDALLIGADVLFTTRRDQIVAQAARHALPAIYTQSLFARAGGLLSYGSSLPALYRLKGNYTARILAGAKPSDLPVQETTALELAINLKTAKQLGLAIPLSLLGRADEVIE